MRRALPLTPMEFPAESFVGRQLPAEVVWNPSLIPGAAVARPVKALARAVRKGLSGASLALGTEQRRQVGDFGLADLC